MTRHAGDLAPEARDLLERSVVWMDGYWDAERCLLWEAGEVADPHGSAHSSYHIVRESAWYALGLLMRGRAGDARRAVQALEAILSYQFDEPGAVYHGTFYRAPEEPHPPAPAIEWRHYDPNWREFIITTFAVILSEYEEGLPQPLVRKIDVAVRKAVEGALARPLRACYTNIALMNAHMLAWAGVRLGEPVWVQRGEAMGREVYHLFKLHDAFAEYNSPTYYGPDIFALGLWQAYCPSVELAAMAAEMEAVLWRDIAQFYHAGLRNMAGPYDRAYGMDMQRYVALLGAWIWLITGREHAPFPDVSDNFAHASDFCFGPLVAILGPRVPVEVVPHLRAFQGERTVEHVLGDSPRRVASAWVGESVMIGAEYTSMNDIGQGQFHPATIHWNAGAGRVGWVRLLCTGPVDAVASPHRLAVTGSGPLTFQIDAPGLRAEMVGPAKLCTPFGRLCTPFGRWRLPGLDVKIQSAAPGVVESSGEQLLVRYACQAGQENRIVLDLSSDLVAEAKAARLG